MPIIRQPKPKSVQSVKLTDLVGICENRQEEDGLFDALAKIEQMGQSMLTMDTNVRTKSYESALIDAGLSEQTVSNIMTEGNLSGLVGSVETQLAESFLRTNLSNDRYVEKADVDTAVRQHQNNIKNGVKKDLARLEFESTMYGLCQQSKKFDPKKIREEQLEKGKAGKPFEIYSNDKNTGLSITNVPKADVDPKKEEITAKLKQQYAEAKNAAKHHGKSVVGNISNMVGDAQAQSQATLHMTTHALGFILQTCFSLVKRARLKAAMNAGDVDIQNVVTNLIELEKDKMKAEMDDKAVETEEKTFAEEEKESQEEGGEWELTISVKSGDQSVVKKVSELWSFQIMRLYEIYVEEQMNLHILIKEEEKDAEAILGQRHLRLERRKLMLESLDREHLQKAAAEEQANKILDLTRRGSASHSAWLMFMAARLQLAKDLLNSTGSIFVQISDENLPHIREILDEIFGRENFVCQITFRKTNKALGAKLIGQVADYIVWYARDKKILNIRIFLTSNLLTLNHQVLSGLKMRMVTRPAPQI